MRDVTPCGVVWTLHRDGHTRSAEIRHVVAGGLELRFMRDGTVRRVLQPLLAHHILAAPQVGLRKKFLEVK